MSILVELVANAVTTIGLYGGFSAIKSKLIRKKDKLETEKKKKAFKPDEWGGWPWKALHSYSKGYNVYGYDVAVEHFRCPKCKRESAHKLSLCEDDNHYHNSHFHFECTHCSFKCILRTADDDTENDNQE